MPATEKEIVHAVANAIIENKDYLTDLDTKIGDGDHGINMARGFEAVVEAVDKMELRCLIRLVILCLKLSAVRLVHYTELDSFKLQKQLSRILR